MIICVAAVHRLFWKLRRLDNAFSRTFGILFDIAAQNALWKELFENLDMIQMDLRKRVCAPITNKYVNE